MKIIFLKSRISAKLIKGTIIDVPENRATSYINNGYAEIYTEPEKIEKKEEIISKEEKSEEITTKEKKGKTTKKKNNGHN